MANQQLSMQKRHGDDSFSMPFFLDKEWEERAKRSYPKERKSE
jgi:hypothetical protein